MNYIYDIFLNYNKIYYDFFEWNSQDTFIHYKKIPVIKTNKNTFNVFLTKNIKLKDNPLNEGINAEIYTKKGIIRCNNYFILVNNKNAIGIEIDNKLKVINFSSLTPDDELEVINAVKNSENKSIDYEIISQKNNINFKTRQTIEKEEYIKNKLNKYFQNKNYELLDYIYYECYATEGKYKKINDFLKNNVDTLYSILKTINI